MLRRAKPRESLHQECSSGFGRLEVHCLGPDLPLEIHVGSAANQYTSLLIPCKSLLRRLMNGITRLPADVGKSLEQAIDEPRYTCRLLDRVMGKQ